MKNLYPKIYEILRLTYDTMEEDEIPLNDFLMFAQYNFFNEHGKEVNDFEIYAAFVTLQAEEVFRLTSDKMVCAGEQYE